MRSVLEAGLVGLFVFGAVSACRSVLGIEDATLETDASDVRCTLNSDCPGTEICLFERCSIACQADQDCLSGSRCLKTSDGVACVSASDAVCSAGCPDGTVCSDDECRNGCANTSDCSGDQLCTGDVCIGTDPERDPRAETGQGGAGAGGVPSDAGSGGGGGQGGASTTGGGGGNGGTSGSGGTAGSTGGTSAGGTSAGGTSAGGTSGGGTGGGGQSGSAGASSDAGVGGASGDAGPCVTQGYTAPLPPTGLPTLTDVTPKVITNETGQTLQLRGTSFSNPTVELSCRTTSGGSAQLFATPSSLLCNPLCTLDATVDASALSLGDICVLQLTNADGGSVEFGSVGIANPSLGLSPPFDAEPLQTARRAPGAALVKIGPTTRVLYAVGGDAGTAASAMSTVEFAVVDGYGTLAPWQVAPTALSTAKTLGGVASIGRYLYAVGGNDGTGATNVVERALVLSPDETPTIDTAVPGTGGTLDGSYSYRISAVIQDGHATNIGGETLASVPATVEICSGGSVTLTWTAPSIDGIVGYRIYRGAGATPETRLVEVAGTSFTDDGSVTPGSAEPLPLGSTSPWQTIDALSQNREGLAVVGAYFKGGHFLYALMGRDGTTAYGTYEYLSVSVAQDGRQTIGTWTTGGTSTTSPRWLLGAWVMNDSLASALTP